MQMQSLVQGSARYGHGSASEHHHGMGFNAALNPWERLNRYYRFLRRRQELEALDDWLLKDIGISRLEIDYAVRYGRSRD